MKYNIFILGIFFSCSPIIAQNVIEKAYNIPRTGDELVKLQIEFKDPGRKGTNVLWDFSKQKVINNEYKITYSGDSDSLIIAREQRSLYKYSLKRDSLLYIGLENPTTLINCVHPELQFIYPVHYGDIQEGYFHATGDYCNQLDLVVSGKSSYHADACGILLLPEGELLENVLRIHHIQRKIEKQTPHYSYSITDTIYPVDSIDYYLRNEPVYKQTDTYKWYAEGYRYPVFETVINSIYRNGQLFNQDKTSFYYPPGEQNYGLNDDPENREKRERMTAEKEKRKETEEEYENPNYIQGSVNYNVYLNKEKSELRIEYQLEKTTGIAFRLFDIQGKLLFQQPKEIKDAGCYSVNIPVTGNFVKEYLLQIAADEKTYSEKIINN